MTDLVDDQRIRDLAAVWRRMDPAAVAEVLRSTTWSYLTGRTDAPEAPAEPMQDWDTAVADQQRTEERAGLVAWNVVSHDPRFAEQLKRIWDEPFSEDFREFVYLLVQAAAAAGALYAKHLDEDRTVKSERLARAAAALMGVRLLDDPHD